MTGKKGNPGKISLRGQALKKNRCAPVTRKFYIYFKVLNSFMVNIRKIPLQN